VTELGSAAALLLLAVFAWSGAAKLADRGGTATTFAAAGLPAPALLATALPVVELVLAVAFFTIPRVAAPVAVVLLASFTAFLIREVRRGSGVGCGCFGASRAEPVSAVELGRNGLLLLAAVVAAFAETPPTPDLGALAAVCLATGLAAAGLAAVGRRRRTGTVARTR
jgi:uncharacterized membrane protein YphA (DoxX/SURF4 family)